VPALVITHAATEGPGHLSTWLPEGGLDLHVVEPWNGDPLPTSLHGYQALVSMGGPQQAYDDTSADWLRDTKALLAQAMSDDVPVLAICLGAQLLAQAAGGSVVPGPEGPELGVRLVGKKDVAGNDPLFWDLPLSPLVVQWHWDAVDRLPDGATLLMSSPRYPHQAFRVGASAWGLQFHVETPPELVRQWAADDAEAVRAAGLDPDDVVARVVEAMPEVEEVWGEVVRRFARYAVDRSSSTLA
jgi:GMP synthase-like glutamine amidotransferase